MRYGPHRPIFDSAKMIGAPSTRGQQGTRFVSVTINQATGQDDPTPTSPILFDVVFSEAVTGFTDADVALSGTAGATTAVVSGSGATYTVAVTGMSVAGTVTATIPVAVAVSASGTPNQASTSTDNTVTFAGQILYNAMLNAGPAAIWNFTEAGTFLDSSGNGYHLNQEAGTVTRQAWVGPDGVSRARLANGKLFDDSDHPSLDFGAGGISVIMAFGAIPSPDSVFFASVQSTVVGASSVWRLSYETSSHFSVRYGRSDTGGAWRIWRIAKTPAEMGAVRLLCVFMPGDGTTPTVRANGAAWALSSFSGPSGTQDIDNGGDLYAAGASANVLSADLGPEAVYNGEVADFAAIEAAAVAEGWY